MSGSGNDEAQWVLSITCLLIQKTTNNKEQEPPPTSVTPLDYSRQNGPNNPN